MIDHTTYPARVRKMLAGTTPGEWESSPYTTGRVMRRRKDHECLTVGAQIVATAESGPDAALIAETPTLATAYLDAADQLARLRAIPRGCLDYLGGYGGRDLDIYHHGVATVIAAMDHAVTAPDFQTRVVEALGSERANDRRRVALSGAVSVIRSIADGASGAAAAREFLDWMDAAQEPTP